MLSALFPATTMTASANGFNARIAADSRVVPTEEVPSAAGGQGSSALSCPMRDEAPAERTTPHILYNLFMEKR
jgi:hypothetical protein